MAMGIKEYDWQDSDYILGYLGKKVAAARKAYMEFMLEKGRLGQQPELIGGGVIRSAGGRSEVLSMRRRGKRQFSD